MPNHQNNKHETKRHEEKLAAIKAKLANNKLSMPLFDTPRFTRHLEAAYGQMVERYCE